jgi:hypothetical protein
MINELLITIMLVIPAPHTMVDWSLGEIPSQIALIYEDGTETSYNYTSVPCTYKPRSPKEMTFKSPQASEGDFRCYAILELNKPRFIRHQNFWFGIEIPPYEGEEEDYE